MPPGSPRQAPRWLAGLDVADEGDEAVREGVATPEELLGDPHVPQRRRRRAGAIPAGERMTLRASHRGPVEPRHRRHVRDRRARGLHREPLPKPPALSLTRIGPREPLDASEATAPAVQPQRRVLDEHRVIGPIEVAPAAQSKAFVHAAADRPAVGAAAGPEGCRGRFRRLPRRPRTAIGDRELCPEFPSI